MMAITSKNIDLSWRLTFLVPLLMHVVSALICLTGRDLPDGQYKELEQSGAKQKGDSSIVIKVRISSASRQVARVKVGVNVFPPAACSRVGTIAVGCFSYSEDVPMLAAMCGNGVFSGIVGDRM